MVVALEGSLVCVVVMVAVVAVMRNLGSRRLAGEGGGGHEAHGDQRSSRQCLEGVHFEAPCNDGYVGNNYINAVVWLCADSDAKKISANFASL